MNYILIFILAIINVSPLLANQQNERPRNDYQVTYSVLMNCRNTVAEFANHHPKVLHQYDLFADSLMEAQLSEYLSDDDLARIIDAIAFAAKKHRFQTRKSPGQIPYIIHPMGVANQLMTIGNVFDSDIIIGALLHDTVEDTETSFEEIENQFGKSVADYVREVTDNKALPKHVRKQLQIENAPHKSAGAAQIKLSDKLNNLTDMLQGPPANWDQERIDNYFVWAKTVVDALPKVNMPLKHAVDDVITAYWLAQE